MRNASPLSRQIGQVGRAWLNIYVEDLPEKLRGVIHYGSLSFESVPVFQLVVPAQCYSE